MNEVITGNCHCANGYAFTPTQMTDRGRIPKFYRLFRFVLRNVDLCHAVQDLCEPQPRDAPAWFATKVCPCILQTDWEETKRSSRVFLSCSCLVHSISTLVGLPQPCQHPCLKQPCTTFGGFTEVHASGVHPALQKYHETCAANSQPADEKTWKNTISSNF